MVTIWLLIVIVIAAMFIVTAVQVTGEDNEE